MDVTRQEWDSFLSNYPSTHLLQLASWGEFKSSFGWEVVRIAQHNAGAQVLFMKLPLGMSWAYIPKGPIGEGWESIKSIVDFECQRRRTVFLKIEPDYWVEDGPSITQQLSAMKFKPSGHHIQPVTTLVVDLAGSEDEILARMKQKTRYNIRLSERKGVNIFPAQGSSDWVSQFHKLMKITGERDAFGIHSLAYYQSAYEIFWSEKQCELFLAQYEGELLAGLMAFSAGKRAWYFYGASSDQHRNLMAPYALQWAAMKWARSKGCCEYDLWGIPDASEQELEAEFSQRNDGLWGVYRFKRGFGGKLRSSIGAWDRVYHPILYLFYLLWVKKSQT